MRFTRLALVVSVFAAAVLAPGVAEAKPVALSECGNIAKEGRTYLLTKDITCDFGIAVFASNITIDLGGHTLSGTDTTSTPGIRFALFSSNGGTVRNGRIEGFVDGISVPSELAMGRLVISNVQAVGNRESGFEVYASPAIVTNSAARWNGNTGIALAGPDVRVSGTSAVSNGGVGIKIAGDNAVVRGSRAHANGGDYGIQIDGATPHVLTSSATDHGSYGIALTGDDALVKGARATGNISGVVISGDRARVLSSVASDNGYAGIQVLGHGLSLKIDDNTANENGWAVYSGGGFGINGGLFTSTTGHNVAKRNNGEQCNPAELC